jgi:hypothetical protein
MPNGTSIPLAETRIESVLSDALDVLSYTGPEFIHLGPTPEQLETVARRLLIGGVMEREERREELSILIGLLVRLRVKKEKWEACGRYYNHGNFAQAGPADAELTEILVNSLAGDKYQEESITSERLLRAMDLMVSASPSTEGSILLIFEAQPSSTLLPALGNLIPSSNYHHG